MTYIMEWKLLCTICTLPLALLILIPMEHIFYQKNRKKDPIHESIKQECIKAYYAINITTTVGATLKIKVLIV